MVSSHYSRQQIGVNGTRRSNNVRMHIHGFDTKTETTGRMGMSSLQTAFDMLVPVPSDAC